MEGFRCLIRISLESRIFAVEIYFTVCCKLCVDVLSFKIIIKILLYSQQYDKLTIIEKNFFRYNGFSKT